VHPRKRNRRTRSNGQAIPDSPDGPLAPRASKKLRNDEVLGDELYPHSLKMEMDRVPLWRGTTWRSNSLSMISGDDTSYLPR